MTFQKLRGTIRLNHSVEKIGGTSMREYTAVRDNIFLHFKASEGAYQRIFVVSAYGGITDLLLENKKTGDPGIFAQFSKSFTDEGWRNALDELRQKIHAINVSLFADPDLLHEADQFVQSRLNEAENCLNDLHSLCQHGHFELEAHLATVREMLASIGEAHSAWNTARLLQLEGLNACFVDLTGWNSTDHLSLDEQIRTSLADLDLSQCLPIVTGYAHTEEGLMTTFNRGYSEMTFSRIAVVTEAREAIIHKEFHLSSADPKVVGVDRSVPIGRTNYDVADQLANLGMEAIHPKAAKGLRQNNIPLRVKNAFEPDHQGTLITRDYISDVPCVEIIAGQRIVYALEVFDQDMAGNIGHYDQTILSTIKRFKGSMIAKDINANTITHYISSNLSTMKRIIHVLEETLPDSELNQRQVAIVSAIGSDMNVPGILAKTVSALADSDISVLAMHQSMRQVDMQFIVNVSDYEAAIRSLHTSIMMQHNNGPIRCLA